MGKPQEAREYALKAQAIFQRVGEPALLQQVQALLQACEPAPTLAIPEALQPMLAAFVQSQQTAQNDSTPAAWQHTASLGQELLAQDDLKPLPFYAQIEQQTAQCWSQAAGLWNEREKPGDALAAYQQASRLEPANPWHYNGIASLYDHQKEVALALEWYGKALAINPDEYCIWSNRGLTYYHAQNYQGAMDDFSAAIERAPRRARYYSHRGLARSQLGQTGLARQDFEQALSLEVDNNVFMDMAAASVLAGSLPDVMAHLRRAFDLNASDTAKDLPDNPDFDSIRHTPEFQALLAEFIIPRP